ncbi:MAG: cell surface protein SprA [Flavobacteriales bacterium]
MPTYNKSFNWQSQYGFRYDITKNLKLDFNANNNAIVGEPAGRVNAKDHYNYQLWKDSVLTSLKGFGTTTSYDHAVNVTYTLPLDKLPITDWVTVNTTYGAAYKWDRAPLMQDTIGHTIQNSRTISVNGQFNFVSLYNKVKYLKRINDKAKGTKPANKNKQQGKNDKDKKDDKSKDGKDGKGGKDGKDGKKDGKDDKGKKDGKDKKDDKKKQDEEKPAGRIDPLEGLARLLMTIRTGTLTYTQNSGMLLPGWDRKTNIVGMDAGFGAPGWGFIMGQQDQDLGGNFVRDFASDAAGKGWLVHTPSIFTPHTSTRTENINARLSLEPVKGLRVDLIATRTMSENHSSFFRWNATEQRYVNDSPREYGNFSVSMITWGTSFSLDDPNTFVNPNFQKLLDGRATISERLGRAHGVDRPADSTYYSGFNGAQQEVVDPRVHRRLHRQGRREREAQPLQADPPAELGHHLRRPHQAGALPRSSSAPSR